MPILNERGWGEIDHATRPWGAGEIDFGEYTQVEFLVEDRQKLNKAQVTLYFDSDKDNNAQAELKIDSVKPVNVQTEMIVFNRLIENYAQVEFNIDTLDPINAQVELKIDTIENIRAQVEMYIEDRLHAIRAQTEFKIDNLVPINSQVELKVDSSDLAHAQINMVFIEDIRMQVLFALYNVTRTRILYEFPSRGLDGLNWTATSQKPGDFSINNVNNDLEEHQWWSSDGVISSITLTMDSQIVQGLFIDTIFVGGHNLTTSATVVVEASNDAGFSPVEQTINMEVGLERMYWLAPTLPQTAYRYWRFQISDPTNSETNLKIGVILMGAASIMSDQCPNDEIIVKTREFKNAVKTLGYTSVGMSRSVKKSVRLIFRSIPFETGDFQRLDQIADFARTTLKCLWIPDPRSQSLIRRFAAFGKIKTIPDQIHRVKGIAENLDHVNMTFEIDEAE